MTRPGDRPRTSRIIPRRKMTTEEESLEAGHELRDMRLRQVVRWLLLLTVSVTALAVAVTVFEYALTGQIGPLRPVVDEPPRVTPPPQPRLEVVNGEALQALRATGEPGIGELHLDRPGGRQGPPADRPGHRADAPAGAAGPGAGCRDRREPEPPAVTLPQGSSSGRTLERIP